MNNIESNSQVETELKTLDRIFGGGKRVFRIPDYQRGYSWEIQQRADLLKDIEYLIKSKDEHLHYTGTIVAFKRRAESSMDDEEYETFDIVDGQQRVTSLVLLVSVICRKLRESRSESKTEHEVFTKFINNRQGGKTVHKLELGQDCDYNFKRLIKKGRSDDLTASAPSKSVNNLVEAIKQFDDWLENQDIDAVLKCVLKRLGFLFYTPDNNKEIGIMFEVINNRGKPLSELEKIKNYMIYYAEKNDMPEIRNLVNGSWPDILGNLNKADYTSNKDENSFLRYCWIVFWDTNKAKSYHVYDNLKQAWPPDEYTDDNVKNIIAFIDFLRDAAINFAKYRTREGVAGEEKLWLERISCHHGDASSITPLILAISDRAKQQDDRNELFELLEKLNFRYYGTGIAGKSDSGQGELFGLAHNFYNYFGEEVEGEKIDVLWLKGKLRKFIHEKANDSAFVEYLTLDKDEAGDHYHWFGLKFFLASYEEFLQSEQKKSGDIHKLLVTRDEAKMQNDLYHKEHIWAVSETSVIDDGDHRDVNKRRLGNFLLLNAGLNSAVSNKRIEEKIRLYFNIDKNTPNTLMSRELEEFFDKAVEEETRWKKRTKYYWHNVYKRFFDKREEKMINFALERWRVPDLDDNVSRVELDSLNPERNEIYSTKPLV
ncbi:MAG: DUF262 domain-containing protein [Gammaproteobacteria bacterium]|nr:DUF262 domain-containing protein [Gammaproteobacteria bacterium]